MVIKRVPIPRVMPPVIAHHVDILRHPPYPPNPWSDEQDKRVMNLYTFEIYENSHCVDVALTDGTFFAGHHNERAVLLTIDNITKFFEAVGRNGGFHREPPNEARTRSFFYNPNCESLVYQLTQDVTAVNMVLTFNGADFLTHADYPDATRRYAQNTLTRYRAAARALAKFSHDYGVKALWRSHFIHG